MALCICVFLISPYGRFTDCTKTKIMASGPITSWQVDGEIMETVRDFILGGSKITADGDCSHEIKRPLLLGRKAMTNLDSMLKSRGVTLPIQSFSSSHVRMWELDYEESWASKNWCFRTGVGEDSWESLGLQDQTSQWLRKSVLHWKDWCWSWNSNTLATWCEELTHMKRPWYWERLRAGGEGDSRGWDGWMALLTQWTWVWVNSGSWWWTGRPGILQFMGSQSIGHNWETELNWTESLKSYGPGVFYMERLTINSVSLIDIPTFMWSISFGMN